MPLPACHRCLSALAVGLLLGALVGCESKPGSSGATDTAREYSYARSTTLTLGSEKLRLSFDRTTGTVTHLTSVEYGKHQQLSVLAKPEDVGADRLGSLFGSARSGGGATTDFQLGVAGKPSPSETLHYDTNRTLTGVSYTYASGADSPLKVVSDWRTAGAEQVTWTLTVRNSQQTPVEITRLAFPYPVNNNYYDQSMYSQTDEGMTTLFSSAFYLQRFIGGHGSYVLARRLTGTVPNFLFVCGKGTSLEFTHVRKTPWEGIPLLYLYSQGALERLRVKEPWANGHSSLSLGAGEERSFTFHLHRLAQQAHAYGPHEVLKSQVTSTVVKHGAAVIDAYPGYVVPSDGYADVLVRASNTGVSVSCDPPAQVEPVYPGQNVPIYRVRFKQKGQHRLTATLDDGSKTSAHFLAVDSAETLLNRRAEFIRQRQVMLDESNPIAGAILPWDRVRGKVIYDQSNWGSGGYEGGVCDAAFLAWHNTRHPNQEQVAFLEKYVDDYLLKMLQNPSTFEVAWVIQGKTPLLTGRLYNYLHNANVYYAMYRVGKEYELLQRRSAREYLLYSYRTMRVCFERGWNWHLYHVGFMGFTVVYDILESLRAEGMTAEADWLEAALRERGEKLLRRQYPYSAEPLYDTTGYEDVYWTANFLKDWDKVDRTIECAMAQKTYVPSWFWAGSDKRYWDAMENNPGESYYGTDRGENCMHYTTSLTAMIGLDYSRRLKYMSENVVFTQSYAAMLGMLSLIHQDGAASMCYTPDWDSNHAKYNDFSGDVGLGLMGYVRGTRAEVRRIWREFGIPLEHGFGCKVGTGNGEWFEATLNDGVFREFRYHDLDVEVQVEAAQLRSVRGRRDKRAVTVELLNPSPKPVTSKVSYLGLWGGSFRYETGSGSPQTLDFRGRQPQVEVRIAPGQRVTVTLTALES